MSARAEWDKGAALAYARVQRGLSPEPPGARLCAWCDAPLTGRRKRWCSDPCGISAGWAFAGPRGWVSEVLAPKCRRCGIDLALLRLARHRADRKGGATAAAMRSILRKGGYDPTRSLWDADHILALALGGENRPENLQRLCTPCHKAKTAEDAAVIAKRRRMKPTKAVHRFGGAA